MITIGYRGGPLLVSLATGAVLVGVVAAVQPAEVRPAGWAAASGAEAVLPAPAPGFARPLGAGVIPTTTTTASPAPTHPGHGTRTAAPRITPPRITAPRIAAPGPAPTTPRRPAPAAPASGSRTAQVVALTDRARANAGCAALRVDAELTAAAQGHSDDMSAHGYFAHDGQDGRTFSDRITAEGYPSPGGENIAQGQLDAQEVVTAWLNSPGHRRNIEDCSFTTIGVGLAGADRYWTQDFGR